MIIIVTAIAITIAIVIMITIVILSLYFQLYYHFLNDLASNMAAVGFRRVAVASKRSTQ